LPGNYVYSESVQSSKGNSSSTLQERVANESNANGELRQSVTDTTSDNSGNSTQEISWRGDGLYLRTEDFSFGGMSFSCALNPPLQALAYPLAVGRSWMLRSSCPITVFSQRVNVTLQGTAKVSGVDRVLVGGEAVDVWVIDSNVDITGTGGFNFTGHQTATRRLAPRQGLAVSESSTTTISLSQGPPMVATESRQLRRLEPT
jgi:hypothetical protein